MWGKDAVIDVLMTYEAFRGEDGAAKKTFCAYGNRRFGCKLKGKGNLAALFFPILLYGYDDR